jgi:hypothetical protein
MSKRLFKPGDLVQTPVGQAKIYGISENDEGKLYALVVYNDVTTATWWLDRLEPADRMSWKELGF